MTQRGSEGRTGRYVRTVELATTLGLTASRVRRLVYERQIPYYKVGTTLLFRLDEIDAWLEKRRVVSVTEVRNTVCRNPEPQQR